MTDENKTFGRTMYQKTAHACVCVKKADIPYIERRAAQGRDGGRATWGSRLATCTSSIDTDVDCEIGAWMLRKRTSRRANCFLLWICLWIYMVAEHVFLSFPLWGVGKKGTVRVMAQQLEKQTSNARCTYPQGRRVHWFAPEARV